MGQDKVIEGKDMFLSKLALKLQTGLFALVYGVIFATAAEASISATALPKVAAASTSRTTTFVPVQTNTGSVSPSQQQLISAPAPSSGGGDSFSGNSASVIIGVTVAIGALVLVVVAAAIIYFNRLFQRKKKYDSDYLGGSASPTPHHPVGPPRAKASYVGAWVDSSWTLAARFNDQEKGPGDINGGASAESDKENNHQITTAASTVSAEALQQNEGPSSLIGCHPVSLSNSESNGGEPEIENNGWKICRMAPARAGEGMDFDAGGGPSTTSVNDPGAVKEDQWNEQRDFKSGNDDGRRDVANCNLGGEAVYSDCNGDRSSVASSSGSICMWVVPPLNQAQRMVPVAERRG